MLTLTFEWHAGSRDQPNHVKQPNPDPLIQACFKTDPPDEG